MKRNSQSGIAHLGAVLLLIVAAVIAFAGYKVVQNHKTAPAANSNPPVATKTVQTIQSKADLNTAEASLNSQNIDGDLNPSQYNQDVNSLL